MAGAIYDLFNFYDFFEKHSDPRSKEWILMNSVWIPLILLALYFWVSIYLGPSLMKDRSPVAVGNFLEMYNLFILFLNLGLTIFFVYYQIILHYNQVCQPVNSQGESELKLAKGFYVFFLSKLFELTDTLMIILKKKWKNLNFMHLYHHSSMVIVAWWGVRFVPGGSSVIIATINTFFHFIIYAYYYLSRVYRLRITFNRVTTFSQVIQFSLVILHSITAYFKNCGFPRSLLLYILTYVASFLLIFVWYMYLDKFCCTTIDSEVQTKSGSSRNPPGPPPSRNESANFVPTPGTFQSKAVIKKPPVTSNPSAAASLAPKAEAGGHFVKNLGQPEVLKTYLEEQQKDFHLSLSSDNVVKKQEIGSDTEPPPQEPMKSASNADKNDLGLISKSSALMDLKTKHESNVLLRKAAQANLKTKASGVVGTFMELQRRLNSSIRQSPYSILSTEIPSDYGTQKCRSYIN